MNEILKYELLHIASIVITVGNIVALFLILTGAYLLLRLLTSMLRRLMRARAVPEGRQDSFLQLTGYVVWTLAVIFGLQSLGLNITFLVASSAALLIGIGLGLQNVFKDFVSGIIILLEGTVKAGDVVEIDGWVVKVKEVSLRTSRVVTREDNVVIIPNHKFIEENVINWTHNATPSRFELNVGVDYASNIRQVERVLIECARQHDDLLQTDPHRPYVRLMDFGSSSLDFQIIFWSNNMFRIESVKSQLRFAIVEAFHTKGITIPFTQVVLHQAAIPAAA
ncbi:MAG TPA: mechanosensitive ion channel [Saprospiraceae bacterium]|nr:mechanosensitive ion channel [Saprospiraceae bacterium]